MNIKLETTLITLSFDFANITSINDVLNLNKLKENIEAKLSGICDIYRNTLTIKSPLKTIRISKKCYITVYLKVGKLKHYYINEIFLKTLCFELIQILNLDQKFCICYQNLQPKINVYYKFVHLKVIICTLKPSLHQGFYELLSKLIQYLSATYIISIKLGALGDTENIWYTLFEVEDILEKKIEDLYKDIILVRVYKKNNKKFIQLTINKINLLGTILTNDFNLVTHLCEQIIGFYTD